MEGFLTLSSSLILIKKVQDCRLYLQVIFLSDITNFKGYSILPQLMTRIRTKHRNSKYN